MPKTQRNHQQTKGAVLARERRQREKKEMLYNDTLKDFLKIKYSHIIAEFEPVYEAVMVRRPRHFVYTNTREFRMWRRRELHKEIHPIEQQQVEQPMPAEQQVEQPMPAEQQVEQPTGLLMQDEQLNALLQDEQLNALLQDEQLNEMLQQIEPLEDNLVANPDLLVNEIVVNSSNDDEGINLDAWEELQGDIRDFDYRMEVELGRYLQ